VSQPAKLDLEELEEALRDARPQGSVQMQYDAADNTILKYVGGIPVDPEEEAAAEGRLQGLLVGQAPALIAAARDGVQAYADYIQEHRRLNIERELTARLQAQVGELQAEVQATGEVIKVARGLALTPPSVYANTEVSSYSLQRLQQALERLPEKPAPQAGYALLVRRPGGLAPTVASQGMEPGVQFIFIDLADSFDISAPVGEEALDALTEAARAAGLASELPLGPVRDTLAEVASEIVEAYSPLDEFGAALARLSPAEQETLRPWLPLPALEMS
jgi:hypothetical protein